MKTRIFLAIVAIALLNAQTLVAQQRTRVLTDYADRCENGDWSKAFEAALSEGDTVVVPAGEYRCGTVRVPSGKTIVGEGAELKYAILDKDVTVTPGAKLIGTRNNPVIVKRGETV